MECEAPIKVLQILEATGGGTRKHLLDLLRGLDRRRFEPVVACPSTRHPSFGQESIVGDLEAMDVRYQIVEMQRAIRPLDDLRSLLSLYRLMRDCRFDIVHVHSSKAGMLGRLAARLAGVPAVVYTPHGLFFLGKRGWQRGFFRSLEQLVGWLTDCTIAVSPSELGELLGNRIARPGTAVLIENGIALEDFSRAADPAATRAALGLAPDVPVVGTTSRLNPQKDPQTLLRAIGEVMASDARVRFVWVSDGELRDVAEALVTELGIADRVIFTGFRSDVLDVMATFDIFAVSSLFEGMPYTLLEAMALRKPVVATDVVGSRDIVVHGTTGLIVPPRSPAALAAAVRRLLADPALAAAMGAAGRQVVEERFSLRDSIGRTEQLYLQLAARRGHLAHPGERWLDQQRNGHAP